MNVKELVTHMKNHSNLFIIGPYADPYLKLTDEEVSKLCLRTIVREPKLFYELFNEKIKYKTDKQNPVLKQLEILKTLGLIDAVFCQTTNAAYSTLNATYLRGSDDSYRCMGCGAITSCLPEDYLCSCGKMYRPDILLNKEKYNLDRLQQFEDALKQYNTIFFIGFDFNEEEFVKQLYVEANKKFNDKPVMTVSIGECDMQALYEEFHFDFIVDEVCDTALERFVKIVECEMSED